MGFRLEDLARHVGAKLHGDPGCVVSHIDTLQDAKEGALAFLANAKYRKFLQATHASAVILGKDELADCPVDALVSENPHLAYARLCRLIHPTPPFEPGVHSTAVVASSAVVDESAGIGPCAVIGEQVTIGPGVYIGPGCYVGEGSVVGASSRLVANVTLCHGSRLGARVLIHPGAVIGGDGFGLIPNENGEWEKVPQLGCVELGDDVEVGANTTIDRGALRDTVIGKGVKLDNQIQVAHNVQIGAHTALAGCAGIAGSTVIGEHCTIAGGVGIAGHLEIADNVHFSGMSLVTRSFTEPGYYSGNLPAVPTGEWRKVVARIRRLDDMAKRLNVLEKRLMSEESRSLKERRSE